MLSHLNLRSFKAFENLSIELKPITLLLGPNNSGKSSILASIRLLVQTIDSYDSDLPLLLNGPLGDFGTYRDIVFSNNRKRVMEIGIGSVPKDNMLLGRQLSLFNNKNNGEYEAAYVNLSYKYRPKRRELVLRSSELKIGEKNLIATKYSEDTERQLIERIGDSKVPSTLKAALSSSYRTQNFLPRPFISSRSIRNRTDGSTLDEFLTPKLQKTLQDANSISGALSRALQNVEYIGAMRSPPARTYLFTGEKRQRVGATGDNAASILVMDAARGGSRSLYIREQVKEWLAKADIASNLSIKRISDRHYEIRIQHPHTHEDENIADVGQGNSQILPVLVGGYNLRKGASYLVEEPEIHLHPRAQSELGSFFFDLYERNVQSIIETHSEYLIIRLQQLVAAGKIPADDVAVYYVYAAENKKTVTELKLDNLGRFINEWPEGFFPERLEEAEELSRIRYRARKKPE